MTNEKTILNLIICQIELLHVSLIVDVTLTTLDNKFRKNDLLVHDFQKYCIDCDLPMKQDLFHYMSLHTFTCNLENDKFVLSS